MKPVSVRQPPGPTKTMSPMIWSRAYNGVARNRRYKGFWNSSGGFTVR